MKLLAKFYKFVFVYKWNVILLAVVTGVAVTLESLQPYWVKRIVDSAQAGKMEELGGLLLMFGVSTIIGNWISAGSFYVGDTAMVPLMRSIKEAVFKKIMDLDFAFHTEKNTGSLISAFRRGEGAVFNVYFNIHQELYRVLIHLSVTLYFLIRTAPETAITLAVFFGLNMFLIWWLIKMNLRIRTEFNAIEDKVAGVIADDMINYETVKFFAAEKKEERRLKEVLDEWTKRIWKHGNSFRVMDVSIGTTGGLGVMLILWMTINKLKMGMGIGDFVLVTGFVTSFYYQFFNLFFRIREIAKSTTDLEKYLEILDHEVAVKDPKRAVVPKKIRGKIDFENVGFVYPKNNQKILDRINLTINPGERVAFVGRSGAGKTTLVKLLLRFYDTSEGVIKIDGVGIKKMNKSFLRACMGVVPQEPIMFNNTIKFNLAYGKEGASIEEMREAARKANILDFIEGLKDGWETQVGERGIKLSGGQKQRLAIARALLADPKVLVFDEATSNLDSESEGKIQAALEEAGRNRTVIIIAHRFSTIRNADKIVVLSNGTIAEIGKHDELIDKGGIYKILWTLQAKGKLATEEDSLINVA